MSFGTQEAIILLVIILVIFGAGKLPKVMGDLGKGMKSFKESMNEDNSAEKPNAEKTENSEVKNEK